MSDFSAWRIYSAFVEQSDEGLTLMTQGMNLNPHYPPSWYDLPDLLIDCFRFIRNKFQIQPFMNVNSFEKATEKTI
jgi:hypothetical protein